jgi:molecular chaperone GrpE (heat shock protein)
MGFRYGNIDGREPIANKRLGNIGIIDYVQLKIAKEKPSRNRKEDDRIACQLFNKMATSLHRKAFKLAEHSSRIQRQEAKVEELRSRKREKVVSEDPNHKFTTIEDVISVKENLAKTLESTKANTVFNFVDMCTEWPIYDVVVWMGRSVFRQGVFR